MPPLYHFPSIFFSSVYKQYSFIVSFARAEGGASINFFLLPNETTPKNLLAFHHSHFVHIRNHPVIWNASIDSEETMTRDGKRTWRKRIAAVLYLMGHEKRY